MQLFFILLAQAEQEVKLPPGAGGWASFGLAGLILAWLFMVHLPAKDKLILDQSMIARQDRDEDRKFRHELGNKFSGIVAEVLKCFKEETEKDRDARERRDLRVEDALKLQTAEITKALALSNRECKYVATPPKSL